MTIIIIYFGYFLQNLDYGTKCKKYKRLSKKYRRLSKENKENKQIITLLNNKIHDNLYIINVLSQTIDDFNSKTDNNLNIKTNYYSNSETYTSWQLDKRIQRECDTIISDDSIDELYLQNTEENSNEQIEHLENMKKIFSENFKNEKFENENFKNEKFENEIESDNLDKSYVFIPKLQK